MESIVKRLIETRKSHLHESYVIARIERTRRDEYKNYMYLQKGTRAVFKYGLITPQHIQKFDTKDQASEKLSTIPKNDDYVYKIIPMQL